MFFGFGLGSSIVIDLPQDQNFVVLRLQGNGINSGEIQSLCFEFKLTGPLKDYYVFADKANNREYLQTGLNLRMWLKERSGFITLDKTDMIWTRPSHTVTPYTWQHFCLSVDGTSYTIVSDNQTWFQYSNDKLKTRNNVTITEIFFGDKELSWIGQLAGLNIWSKALTTNEMLEITSKCRRSLQGPKPDLLDWSEVTGSMIVQGSYNESQDNPCIEFKKHTKVLPIMLTPKDGRKTCQVLGGQMSYHDDLDITEAINQDFISTTCTEDADFYVSTPYSRLANGSWMDDYTQKLVDLDPLWANGQPNGLDLQNCTTIKTKDRKIYDQSCSVKHCFACTWTSHTVFYLRGLCAQAKIDAGYVLLLEHDYNGQVVFAGFESNTILYSQKQKDWLIIQGRKIDMPEEDMTIIGRTLNLEQGTYGIPVGTFQWNISSHECNQPIMQLKLTSCSGDQFTCDDGTCIELRKRCDNVFHCKDNSDEKSCNLLEMDDSTYRNILPPISEHGRTELSVAVNIKSIDSIDEQAMTFNSKLSVHLYWKDSRITYKNLNNNGNFLSKELQQKIWLPLLTFSNTASNFLLTKDESKTVQVLQQSKGQNRDFSHRNEAVLHQGHENELVLFGQYDLTFDCEIDLSKFPFDQQECSIDIAIPQDMSNLTVLKGRQITYSGPDQLLQFSVSPPFFNLTENGAKLKCVLELKRIPAYMIINCYLASASIILMTLVTLFLKNDMHFSTTIMLVLTSQLCLFTLFQTNLNDVPKTAYLKMIDLWSISALTIPFLIFFNLIIWEMAEQRMAGLRKWEIWKFVCRLVIPSLSLLGLVVYISVAALQ